MAKTLLAIAFVAVAIAAPYLIPGLIGVAAGSLAAIAVTAAVEIGVSLAAGALLGPALPKGLGVAVNNQVQRLFVTMEPTTPRKIVYGDTAGATDLRYQTYTDKNSGDQGYYHEIIAVASHQVNSIYEIWFDNEKAWTSAGGVQGRFVGFLLVTAINLGTSANGILIDSKWTTSCRLTGCAYVYLKFDLVGSATDGSNNSPFASGVTTRVTIRTQGALIYDPRLDSTVAGGSGSQRPATQSTWAWSSSASRNPALQLLWYLLGWQIGGKLAVGMGVPSSRIDLASFAVAANACDASITLNGGGTEPRYRADGVITEGDDRRSVIESLCATMNAVPRDAGGKISLTVLTNDLSTPTASFTEGDILGGEQWDQTPDLSSCFNICRGRRIDPSDNSLYQLVDTPEAKLTSNDGIDRIDTMDMPFVQSNGQAQRLLKQRLQRKQYQGRYSLTGGSRWWQVSIGNVVQLSHQGLGWSNKLFRVASQSIARTGQTKLTLIEENAAIYAWANNESAAVTAGAPTVYNPLNSPLLTGMKTAGATSVLIDPPSPVTIYADATGAPRGLPLTMNITASKGINDITALGTWSQTSRPGATTSIGAATGVFTISGLTASSVRVPISFTYAGITRTTWISITRVDDASGSSGGTGSSSATMTTLGNTTGTAYDLTNSISGVMTVAAGSGGQVACVAPITFSRLAGTNGDTAAAGKWQWRVPAGTWADIATEVASSASASKVSGDPLQDDGALSVSQTKSGLTVGSSYEFRFVWRDVTATGVASRIQRVYGTMTATGQ
jgi:hypothetical protein